MRSLGRGAYTCPQARMRRQDLYVRSLSGCVGHLPPDVGDVEPGAGVDERGVLALQRSWGFRERAPQGLEGTAW
jgi:hypothetical protein